MRSLLALLWAAFLVYGCVRVSRRAHVGRLHGGQLVILLLGLVVVASAVTSLAASLAEQTRRTQLFASAITEEEAARLSTETEIANLGTATLMAGALACAIAALGVSLLWKWFGSRATPHQHR